MTVTDVTTCPVRHNPVHQNFNPLDEDYLSDPYPILNAVREETPGFYSPELGVWVITRPDDIETVFKDPATFSAAVQQRPIFPMSPAAQAILKEGFHATPVMSDCDPPKHTRIRAHNMKSFSARRTAKLEPMILAKATELIDAIKPGEVDLVSALTYPLPAYMIFTFIGFPEEDMEMIKEWCGNRILFSWGRPTPAMQEKIATNMVKYYQYCVDFVAKRVADPQDDFASDLIRIHQADPDAISLHEIANVCFGVSFAGHETTTNLTSAAMRHLLTHRQQWQDMCADRSLIGNVVEETLRYDSSIIAWRRITTRPVTIGGLDIPAGGTVMVLLGAANRSPERFANPDSFDIHRDDARGHIAFGKGIHYCLGASLARMEARIVLDLLASRAPGMTIVPDQELHFPANISFRGPERLLVNWPA